MIISVRHCWIALALLGSLLLAVALYYQYVLGDEPCQVCIQARLWVCALVLVSVVFALLPQGWPWQLPGHGMALASCFGLGERAWVLYQLENGKGDSSCEFQLGMPDWFAVDRWFPALFEVRNLCSFTPAMPFGLTMAEGLLLVAAGLGVIVLISLWQLKASTP